ncbi:MAG: hypothetical protein ACK5XN_10200 [Bacteroidota bacterium]|jgi:hypothetical protein
MARARISQVIAQVMPTLRRGAKNLASDARRTTNKTVIRAVNLLEGKKLLPKRQAVKIRDAVRLQHTNDMIAAGDAYATSRFLRENRRKLINPVGVSISARDLAKDDIRSLAGQYLENPRVKRTNKLEDRARKFQFDTQQKYGDREWNDPMKSAIIDYRTNEIIGYRNITGSKDRAYAQYDKILNDAIGSRQKAYKLNDKLASSYRSARRNALTRAGIGLGLGAGVGTLSAMVERRRNANTKGAIKKQVGVGEMMYVHDNVLGKY